MKSRITQLIARVIGAAALFVAARLGLSEDQQATVLQFSAELAAWIVALGAFAFDLFIHRLETGAVTAPAGTPANTKNSATLNSWAWPALLIVALLLGGCAKSAKSRYYEQVRTKSTAQEIALTQHQAGNISDAKLIELDTYEKAWRSALDLIKRRLDAPTATLDELNIRAMLDTAEAVASELIRFTKQHEGATDGRGNDPGGTDAGAGGDSLGSAALRADQRTDHARETKRPADARADRTDRAPAAPDQRAVGRSGRAGEGARVRTATGSPGRRLVAA